MMDIDAYLKQLQQLAGPSGFVLSSYGKVGSVALPVLERAFSESAPSIYLSAGVHGNEPAGPLTILELLENRILPDFVNLTIFPLVNPLGLAAGTRENLEGIDLNRDYGSNPQSSETQLHTAHIRGQVYDLALCLHEDDDGEGFYLYSHLSPDSPEDLPELALTAAEPHAGIDQRRIIDEMPARNGRVYPPDSVINGFGDNLPEALRLNRLHGARLTFTTETPSCQPMQNRTRAQIAAIEAILNGYLTRL